MRQFKLNCCGAIISLAHNVSKIPHACGQCGATSFFAEELDKDEQVYVMGHSGDKREEVRPWGSFKNLLDEEGYKVKKIIVNPNQRLSLQLHRYRNESWQILSGAGEMQVGSYIWPVSAGSAVYIEKLQPHRITNENDEPLVILEVQRGVCKENDILRIEDDYGRIQ